MRYVYFFIKISCFGCNDEDFVWGWKFDDVIKGNFWWKFKKLFDSYQLTGIYLKKKRLIEICAKILFKFLISQYILYSLS